MLQFGALTTHIGEFLNPGFKFGTSQPAPALTDWFCAPGNIIVRALHAQVAAPPGTSITYTLFTGAPSAPPVTGNCVATAVTVTVALGGIFATQGGYSLLIPDGNFILMQTNRNVNDTACEVDVLFNFV